MSADIIPFRIERQDDGEARVSDVEMAEQLGYARVSNLRSLIRQHAKTLNEFNHLRAARHRNENGGRAALEYWLTEPQATFIVLKSDMPKATEIAVAIVKAFIAELPVAVA